MSVPKDASVELNQEPILISDISLWAGIGYVLDYTQTTAKADLFMDEGDTSNIEFLNFKVMEGGEEVYLNIYVSEDDLTYLTFHSFDAPEYLEMG